MDEWGIDEGLEELDRLKSLYQGAKGKKRRGKWAQSQCVLSSGCGLDVFVLSYQFLFIVRDLIMLATCSYILG